MVLQQTSVLMNSEGEKGGVKAARGEIRGSGFLSMQVVVTEWIIKMCQPDKLCAASCLSPSQRSLVLKGQAHVTAMVLMKK